MLRVIGFDILGKVPREFFRVVAGFIKIRDKDILQVPGLCAANSNMLREILRYYEIPVLTSTSLLGIQTQNGLQVRVKEKDGSERLIDADHCILSVGYQPVRGLVEKLKSKGCPEDHIHVIGDAHEVGNLMSVIHEAYDLCYAL